MNSLLFEGIGLLVQLVQLGDGAYGFIRVAICRFAFEDSSWFGYFELTRLRGFYLTLCLVFILLILLCLFLLTFQRYPHRRLFRFQPFPKFSPIFIFKNLQWGFCTAIYLLIQVILITQRYFRSYFFLAVTLFLIFPRKPTKFILVMNVEHDFLYAFCRSIATRVEQNLVQKVFCLVVHVLDLVWHRVGLGSLCMGLVFGKFNVWGFVTWRVWLIDSSLVRWTMLCYCHKVAIVIGCEDRHFTVGLC